MGICRLKIDTMKKIKNKKTGEIKMVKDHELSKYGLGGNVDMAKNGKKIKMKLKKAAVGQFIPQNQPLELDETTLTDYKQSVNTGMNNNLDFQLGKGFIPQQFNPSLTNSLETYNKKQGYNYGSPSLSPEEQTQYNQFKEANKTKVNLQPPNISPITGNKYLNRGLTYMNQAIKHGSNINSKNPNMTPDYNGMGSMFANGGLTHYDFGGAFSGQEYNVGIPEGMFRDPKNGELTYKNPNFTFVNGNTPQAQNRVDRQHMRSDKMNDFIGTNSLKNMPGFDQLDKNGFPKEDNQTVSSDYTSTDNSAQNQNNFSNIGQGIAAGVNATQGLINFGKGALDIIGSQKQNREAQKLQSQLYTQSVFSQGIDDRPMDYINNRNALQAADGMQIKEVGGKGVPNVEVEKSEHILLPSGFSQEIQGKTHAEGGIPLSLPENSKVFSEKLKVDGSKKGKSYADLAKPLETKKNVDMLEAKGADDIQKSTADMMIKFKKDKLEQLFNQQEMAKINGKHGIEVQNNAIQDYQMANGGLIKAEDGWKGQTFKTKEGFTTPTGQNLNSNPLLNWQGYKDQWEKLAGTKFKNTKDLQEFAYDWALDNNPQLLKDTWKTFGVTNKDESKYKNKDVNNLSPQDLKDLRGNFIDNLRGKRMFSPQNPPVINQQPAVNQPIVQEQTPQIQFKDRTQYLKPNVNIEGANLGIPLPNVYEEGKLNYYKTNPNYIDPRYLNNLADRAAVAEGQRAVQTNIGGRGTGDISNLLQSQINSYKQLNQLGQQKWNYDRNQDITAQTFNAQAKTQNDQYNQGTWFNQLEDPHRRIISNIGDQQLTDDYRGQERFDQLAAYNNDKNYIDKTFTGYQNLKGSDLVGFLGSPQYQDYMDKNKTTTKTVKNGNTTVKEVEKQAKFGGKVGNKLKIKPKFKKK